ncbi:flavin-containing monooxygenase 5, partial [Aplysia californica]|uniref:Flavin-containing monooxygenase n=1 Tax=Aplysia californica TaxID=6500 RepID=A0ABM1AFK2_APLCA
MPIFNEFLRRNSMAPNTKRVCVVGAGAAGLCAVKECLHQGLQPVGYEMDDDLGGVWRRAEEGEPVLKPMMYDNLVTNTTKWTMSYSDFPPLPQDTPIYTRKTLLAYYERYADHFNLRQYIVFNTRIMKIKRAPSYERTGQWLVHIALVDREGNPVEGQNMQTELFDCVIVCNGYFRSPRYPTNLPGRDTFPGFQEHSITYRNNE